MLATKLLEAAGNSTQPVYIEDVFSTYLYTGNGSTQTITNGIDLAGKGGLNWTKRRVSTGGIGDTYHILTDTVRGANKQLYSNGADAQATNANMITSFNADGYSIGSDGNVNFSNASPQTYASWTFRKQPKFFDVVTYTGNGVSGRQIAHNLGSVPGCIIVKCTSTTTDWIVYHRSLPTPTNQWLQLNSTNAALTGPYFPTAPDANNFYLAGSGFDVNTTGQTYVAYLFAHDAGGFGLTGTDNVISCGSFTVDGSGNASVNLGYEPQYVLYKKINSTGAWYIDDTMRGLYAPSQAGNSLRANAVNAEGAGSGSIFINSTGFTNNPVGTYVSGDTVIYIAIRRGPMKVPTDATKVFAPVTYAGGTNPATLTTNFPVDYVWSKIRDGVYAYSNIQYNRLNGRSAAYTRTDNPQQSGSAPQWNFDNNAALVCVSTDASVNMGGYNYISHFLRRAPKFFDLVSYTGTGSTQALTHNLTIPCEMMWVKRYDTGAEWWAVYHSSTGASNSLALNSSNPPTSSTVYWNSTSPTSTQFTVGTSATVNTSGGQYIAHLFGTCPGVSKVGSYTGNGTTQTINCGFTGGARFVLIKRTDSTGDWYVWDTARGIVSGNDPYLLLNSTAAEVTTTDYIDPVSSGFEISSTAPAAINASGGSYIYLAIA